MDLLNIGLRTVVAYVVVFLALRIMGKREIGKLSIFDLVISVMIAEIAVIAIEDDKKTMVQAIVPIFVLVVIQLITAYSSLKSRALRLKLDGRPSILIRNGKLDRNEMRKQKYNLDDLLTQLRERNVTDLGKVEFALLESTGKLTVVEKDENESNKSGKIPELRYEGLPIPLIMDGKVQDQNLELIGKTRFWLKNQLQERGIGEMKDVFLCTYDHKGQIYIDKK